MAFLTGKYDLKLPDVPKKDGSDGSSGLMNFHHKGLELKMTEHQGRGLYASQHLKKGELLIGESAIASGEIGLGGKNYAAKKCLELAELKGAKAWRLS